jgi:FkbM family methyltransferase
MKPHRSGEPMNLSYAQRLEDYHLACAFDGQPSGFYVDIGGGHPVADNVSYWFYLQGWRGLVVEPQERLCDLYRSLRPRDLAICSLVGRRIGEADFHVVETLHGLSTMVEPNARMAAELGATYTTTRRPVTTLAQLFEANGIERIDFLKVDVEGAEADVFAGADWDRWRPRIIVAEVVALGAAADAWMEWDPILVGQRYRFTLFDGLNRFYVAEEEAELARRLPREPAPWHVVRHLYEFGRAPENPDHPDHALARRLVSAFLAGLPAMDEERLLSLVQSIPHASLRRAMHLLPGGAETPANAEEQCRALIRSDAFRAALGRIAAPFDGGLMLDDEPVRPD